MTTSYPPPPSRDPPPELPRRRNVPEPVVPVASSSSSSHPDPTVMDSIKAKLPFTHEHDDDEDDSFDVIGYWAITALSWLFILSVPLLLFPRLLAFLAQSNDASFNLSSSHKKGGHYDDLTPLEKLLAQQLGWGCVGVAVVLACIIAAPHNPIPPFPPLSTSSTPPSVPSLPLTTTLRLSILLTISSLFSLSAFFVYNNKTVGSAVSVGVGMGNAILGIWGFWVGVFGFGGRTSQKTGADKRTSAFPLKNKNAASVQKSRWREEQERR